MAEIVTIEGQQFKKRSPWGAWLLGFTIVYAFVWYYKINDEARRYLRDDSIRPGLAVLALFVPIVNIVSMFRTGERIGRMEANAGIQSQVEPILGVVAGLVAGLHVVYYQIHLNKIWERYQPGGGASSVTSEASPPQGTTPIPPPPPQ